jgi:hypothetical protein
MCDKCRSESCNSNDGGSFAFGLILGILIGAIVAIVIYRQNKGKIYKVVETKFNQYFKPQPKKSSHGKERFQTVPSKITIKKTVELPPQIVEATTPTPIKKPSIKKFVKPKK